MLYDNSNFAFEKDATDTQRVGILTKELADLIRTHLDLDFSLNDCDIIINGNNIGHIKNKHQSELDNYSNCVVNIISTPDYVGMHPSKKSIEFIKQLDVNLLVAVRIKNKDPLWMKSFYEINPTKLQNYISSGRVFKVNYSDIQVASTKE